MKKQLFTIATILAASIGSAQTWSENFSSPTPPALPTTWLQYNGDALTPNTNLAAWNFGTNAWVTRDISSLTYADAAAHGKVAASTSWYTPIGTANDWLITPSFTVSPNSIIQWEALAADPAYQDGYSVKISTTGTLTTDFSVNLLTVSPENGSAWAKRSINLNSYAGQTVRIAFVNNSTDKYVLLLDNISVVIPAPNDLKLTSIAPTGGATWGMVGSSKTISGTVQNNGYNAVTTFTAKYSDGITTQSSVFTGLNLTYGQTYNFSVSTPFSIVTPTESKIKVWNQLTGDSDLSSDTLATFVNGYSFLPNHKVVFEEGTGTWCGWCVRGAVYMDSMHFVNPNSTVLIAVHNADPMTVTAYDAGIGTLISGYPTVLCGRAAEISDPSDMFNLYSSHLNDFGLADLTLTSTYNSATRLASIAVDTKIASTFANNNATKDFRIAVVFTEDNVRGSASTYDQHNYYSGGAYGPMVGAGHHFETEANPVPAANIKYDFVARAIIGGFSGLANSLPNNLVAGSTTSNTFTYTVPGSYNIGNVKAHALLIDSKNNVVYNANSVLVDPSAVSVREVASEIVDFGLYPNPTVSNATVKLNLTSSQTVSINIYNTLGALVYSDVKSALPAGQNEVHLNTENLANGIYNVSISTGTGMTTKKLTINK